MSHSSHSSHGSGIDPKLEEIWAKADVDLEALSTIISAHFRMPCVSRECLGIGGYARTFKCTLQDGKRLVAKVTLPVREVVKTEAEVAAMDSMRARTSITVPLVYLYCSSQDNPVKAEWIVMDFMDGVHFSECFRKLTVEQQKTAGEDMARVMTATFALTATHCGSMLRDCSLRDDQRAVRYSNNAAPTPHNLPQAVRDAEPSGEFMVGPVNEVVFLDHENPVPASSSGPFATESEYLEAVANMGRPATRPSGKSERWPYERVFEVYEAIRPLYHDLDTAPTSTSGAPTLHFTHNDLTSKNVLLDPETGHITAVLDWEMAGFFPSWHAAEAGADFDDDYHRFIFEDWQEGLCSGDCGGPEAAEVHKHFRDELKRLDPLLFANYWRGVELRALLANFGQPASTNVLMWLEKYAEYHWDVNQRGPFPFDLPRWVNEQYEVWRSER
ncbi:kinase-like protein [Phanerochaete sordida]|uniref:Kinase-like protein n=1 Tax=Phanerochaete sordida TaxID=48140 RepID=A0A9P3LIR9_9APHY|nr:kinase-like protein [Phanerochaete sordida]